MSDNYVIRPFSKIWDVPGTKSFALSGAIGAGIPLIDGSGALLPCNWVKVTPAEQTDNVVYSVTLSSLCGSAITAASHSGRMATASGGTPTSGAPPCLMNNYRYEGYVEFNLADSDRVTSIGIQHNQAKAGVAAHNLTFLVSYGYKKPQNLLRGKHRADGDAGGFSPNH